MNFIEAIDLSRKRGRDKDRKADPELVYQKLMEMEPLVSSALNMELDSILLNQLGALLEWAFAEICKEPPESPMMAFAVVRNHFNNQDKFEEMLRYKSDESQLELRQLRNALNRINGMCELIEWPKPKPKRQEAV